MVSFYCGGQLNKAESSMKVWNGLLQKNRFWHQHKHKGLSAQTFQNINQDYGKTRR